MVFALGTPTSEVQATAAASATRPSRCACQGQRSSLLPLRSLILSVALNSLHALDGLLDDPLEFRARRRPRLANCSHCQERLADHRFAVPDCQQKLAISLLVGLY